MFSRKTDSKFRPVNLNQEIIQAQKLLSRTVPKTIIIDLHLSGNLESIQGIRPDRTSVDESWSKRKGRNARWWDIDH